VHQWCAQIPTRAAVQTALRGAPPHHRDRAPPANHAGAEHDARIALRDLGGGSTARPASPTDATGRDRGIAWPGGDTSIRQTAYFVAQESTRIRNADFLAAR